MPRRTSTEPKVPRMRRTEIMTPRECKLCADRIMVDYKQPDLLKKFMTERGKILARRMSGNCAKHQRQIARAIKRARGMLLVR